MRTILCVGLVVVFAGPSVADDKKGPPQPVKIVALDRKEPVAYDKDVEPILIKKCTVCHSGNVTEGKFDMGSYETLMKGGKRGKTIAAGKADESIFYKLAARAEKPLMPPRGDEPLTPEELAIIKLWIDQGAKAPSGVKEKVKVVLVPPPAGVHPVRGLAVSPDKSAVAASRGNQIHVYEAGSGSFVRALTDPKVEGPDKKPLKAAHLGLVETLAYSPDGKFLASGGFQEVKLWDGQTGLLRQTVTGFAERVVCLAFSPDGKTLATGGGPPTEDGEIKLIDVATGKVTLEIKNGHSDTVFGISFSPDGKMLATCGADKFVKTFDVATGKLLKSFEGHTQHVMDVGWKSDGKLIVSAGADNLVKVWDYEKGEQARTIPAHGKQITRLAFVGKTSVFITVSGDQKVKAFNVDTGGTSKTYPDAKDFLYAVAVSPDGAVVVAGGQEGVVHLYDGAKAQRIKELLPPDTEPKR